MGESRFSFRTGVEFHYLNHNIVRYRGRYYAIPGSMGAVDLRTSNDIFLSELSSAQDLNAMKQKIILSFPKNLK